ncbi:MAG: hypothetical protein GYB25_11145, partial [Rhodobacteraceae bacterium]|nr:hypothetical protein [Paracoccaceae bacterium]
MILTKRDFFAGSAALMCTSLPAAAFVGSTPKDSPLPGIDITVTRSPEAEPIEKIHIDSEHGKALIQMGPKQAGNFMANILAPKLESLTGVSGRSWHWVLANHLTDEVVQAIFNGGTSELQGMQFADDNGEATWGLTIAG